ncbi:MAG: hypothetical protein M5R36_08020 [Deltaproteobacteria bacterium]|nr:hypothetical protein [Deltaproteobacteria bacterium]
MFALDLEADFFIQLRREIAHQPGQAQTKVLRRHEKQPASRFLELAGQPLQFAQHKGQAVLVRLIRAGDGLPQFIHGRRQSVNAPRVFVDHALRDANGRPRRRRVEIRNAVRRFAVRLPLGDRRMLFQFFQIVRQRHAEHFVESHRARHERLIGLVHGFDDVAGRAGQFFLELHQGGLHALRQMHGELVLDRVRQNIAQRGEFARDVDLTDKALARRRAQADDRTGFARNSFLRRTAERFQFVHQTDGAAGEILLERRERGDQAADFDRNDIGEIPLVLAFTDVLNGVEERAQATVIGRRAAAGQIADHVPKAVHAVKENVDHLFLTGWPGRTGRRRADFPDCARDA